MRDSLNKISIVIGVAGLVTASVQSISGISNLINDNFWLVFFLGMLFTLIPLWPEPDRLPPGPHRPKEKYSNLKRFKWVILAVTCFFFVATHRLYTIYVPTSGGYPVPEPIPVPGQNQEIVTGGNTDEWNNGSGSSSEIQDVPDEDNIELDPIQKPILRRFTLNKLKTSFIESREVFASDLTTPSYRTFKLDPEIYNTVMALNNAEPQCMCGWQSEEYDRTMEALRHYTDLTNEQNLNQYFSTFINLQHLPKRHPDITQRLIPRSNEWNSLTSSDYNTILRWVKCCIGIPYPTFIFSIQNPSETEMIIQEVKFNVKDISRIYPEEEGVFGPEATYLFQLDYAIGSQIKSLYPSGFRIPAKTTKSFEIQLFTNEPEQGLCWLMNIEFISPNGNCKTDDFQLIMSGKSEWLNGNF